MKTIFTIGGATFDMFIRVHDHGIMRFKTPDHEEDWMCLDYGAKIRIDEVIETFGGGATNTAVGFARMGFNTHFVGAVGSSYGDRVIDNLRHEGVDTRFVHRVPDEKTGFSTILNTFEGDRTVLGYPGANEFFGAKHLPLDELGKADWIFLNHLTKEHSTIPNKILGVLKKNPRIKLAWNPGREQIEQGIKKWKPLLDYTDILLVNKEEASLFARTPYRLAGIKQDDPKCHVHLPRSFLPPYADDVAEIMYQFFSKTGVKTVVITDGRNGAQASDGKRLYFCPVPTLRRVDTTGAGDSFGTGFTAAVMKGEGLRTALVFGTLNANSVVGFFGAQKGLLSEKKIREQMKTLDICVKSTKLD